MPDDVKKRMVAAYVLGYKVTPQDTAECKNRRAAKDSLDLGVTICYNSVSDIKYIKPVISVPSAMCINPVNWKTDATPATLHDTITVTLSPEHNVLVLSGYSGSEYTPILGIINTGDFHGAEPWLYSECLAKNIQHRLSIQIISDKNESLNEKLCKLKTYLNALNDLIQHNMQIDPFP